MAKPVLVLAGLVLLTLPRHVAAFGERLAFENPDDAAMRSTTLPAARAEGLLAVWIAYRGRWPSPLTIPLGLAGALMVFVPDRILAAGLTLAYRNPDRIEPKSWVEPVTRFVGLVHLTLALRILRDRRSNR